MYIVVKDQEKKRELVLAARNYIQTWLDKKPTDDIIKIVFKTVDKILNAGKTQRNENAETNTGE